MKTVTDRTSNPFGMRPPCQVPCSESVPAVFGYGDANADFHLIGDHPGRHGGHETGIPFTDDATGERLLDVLVSVGLIDRWVEGEPQPDNLFMSYLHMCCQPSDDTPPAASYAHLERFFDAELRAIAAHILLPVGERPTRHVLREFTAKATKFTGPTGTIHAREIGGRGFLVIPIEEPADWAERDETALADRLERILDSDYRQTADLTRFLGDGEHYLVR